MTPIPTRRIDVAPSSSKGLREPSQIAVDKITVIPATKIGGVIGRASPEVMTSVDRSLFVVLGLA